jgi:ABC-type sugar transport system permease subunit
VVKLSSQKTGMLLIAPAIILICSLLVYPVLYGVWLSLFKKHSFFPDQRFVGLANYLYLLKDSDFWMSVWYGTVYSVSTIVLQIVVGIIAALIVNEAFPLCDSHRGGHYSLEVASQQPIRIGELYDALPWHRRRSGILDG